MKIVFQKRPTAQIAKDLRKMLKKQTSNSASISVTNRADDLTVKISKLGTSTLVFTRKDTEKSAQFSLVSEDIAFAHRAFKAEVKSQFSRVIKELGGRVSGA
jgi:hypothetical protein